MEARRERAEPRPGVPECRRQLASEPVQQASESAASSWSRMGGVRLILGIVPIGGRCRQPAKLPWSLE